MSSVVRRITEADLVPVVEMVHELAEYEHAAAECHLTVDALRTALFGEHPVVFGHVAEVDGEVVGTALWFLNFSTWEGVPGLYLEDLYVRPAHRGGGHGLALMAELAAECVRRGYPRFQWQVLDWNEPSIQFYRRLGAEHTSEWLGYLLTGEALAKAAQLARPS